MCILVGAIATITTLSEDSPSTRRPLRRQPPSAPLTDGFKRATVERSSRPARLRPLAKPAIMDR
jgi:hypothetical protein